MARTTVDVRAADDVLEAGIRSLLRGQPDVEVRSLPTAGHPDVLVVALDRATRESLDVVRAARASDRTPVVLVLGGVEDTDLVSAVELGVCTVLRRADATADRLARVVTDAARGEGALPGDLLGRLVAQLARLQETLLAPRGLHLSGMSDRELDVLRLVAEGLHTTEIARKLAYSERTVKNVLHGVTSRLGLRNRTHAVAYAFRHGLI